VKLRIFVTILSSKITRYLIYFATDMARCSLFVLNVPLNTKQASKHSADNKTN